MKELELKYGCNPNQKPSKIYVADVSELPIKVLSGKPGYINFLDAFNGWQLVRDLKKATGLPGGFVMKELELKYGCNPNQKPSKIYVADGSELPIKVLSGKPGYINFLDAFNGWQLVRDLKKATGLPAATSFKHVSPAGASIGLPLTETLAKIYCVDDMDWKNFTPIACAYAIARGADRMSSFGDFISLSEIYTV